MWLGSQELVYGCTVREYQSGFDILSFWPWTFYSFFHLDHCHFLFRLLQNSETLLSSRCHQSGLSKMSTNLTISLHLKDYPYFPGRNPSSAASLTQSFINYESLFLQSHHSPLSYPFLPHTISTHPLAKLCVFLSWDFAYPVSLYCFP